MRPGYADAFCSGWRTANYACMLVDTYEQSAALVHVRQFDAVMYGHEFIFEGET
jgi:hypothetical protein